MEASQETTPQEIQEKTPPEVMEPTAKEMAAAEELNSLRIKQAAESEALKAERANDEPISIIGLAAKGHNELHDAIRSQRDKPKPTYIPPARTERQMSQLQEELEAGRRTQQRAEEQQRSRPIEKADGNKEGFTTPVHRPNDMVPDPMTTGSGRAGLQPITTKD